MKKKKKKFSLSDYNNVLEKIKEGEIVKKIGKKNNKAKNKNKKKKRSWWKKLITLFIMLASIGVFVVGAFLIYIVTTTSEFDPEALKSQEQSIVYSADGKEIASLGYELREKVTYDELPQVLIDAIVATEDSRFFQHSGVDLPRFLKASFGQLSGNSSAGGASTLTMQVVKNNLTSSERSIIRKFRDMYLATFYLERKYSKEEILEFYVNDSSLGSNVYGVGEASQYYFGKSVSELSLPEAALIAGLYQAPNGYNPYYYPENANKRIKTVLKLMVRHGYITQEEADAAGKIDISTLLVGLKDSDNVYQGYLDTVLMEVEEKTGYSPYLVSMKIYTALDTNIQDGVNAAFNGDSYTWIDDKVQAGAAIINCNNGEIVAVGTGRKQNADALTWNYATRTKRQPGSTAKPIFAYGPGMEYLGYSTGTLFMDEAWSYSNGTSVSNWDRGYQGLITLRQAVAVSRNIPALKAFQQVNKEVGNAKIVEFVENLGIDLKDDVAYESYAIGGLEEGVTPVQMASAYAVFANGGYYNAPHTITKIEYRETGEVVEFNGENNRVIKESTAYLMNNVLEYAVNNGFSGGAKVSGSHVAAKTGTSNFSEATRKKYNLPDNAENDLWTVAYTKNYSVALWYGYDTAKDGYNTVSSNKDRLMSAIIQYVPKESQGWEVPSSVRAVQVERESWPMQLPSEYTPSDLISTEYFDKDYVPVDVSPRFAKLSDITNLTASSSAGTVTLSWNASAPEVISEDYLNKYFGQSVFGNSGGAYKNNRIAYNSDYLGDYGYGIYLKSDNGELTRVGWTKDKTYTYTPTSVVKSVTLVIKAEYEKFKSNASDGVSKEVTITGINSKTDDNKKNNNNSNNNGNNNNNNNNNGNDKDDTLTIALVNNNSSLYGSKEEIIPKLGCTVKYNGIDVTLFSEINFEITGNGVDESANILQLATKIMALENGTYTINYIAKYGDDSVSAKQKFTIT